MTLTHQWKTASEFLLSFCLSCKDWSPWPSSWCPECHDVWFLLWTLQTLSSLPRTHRTCEQSFMLSNKDLFQYKVFKFLLGVLGIWDCHSGPVSNFWHEYVQHEAPYFHQPIAHLHVLKNMIEWRNYPAKKLKSCTHNVVFGILASIKIHAVHNTSNAVHRKPLGEQFYIELIWTIAIDVGP